MRPLPALFSPHDAMPPSLPAAKVPTAIPWVALPPRFLFPPTPPVGAEGAALSTTAREGMALPADAKRSFIWRWMSEARSGYSISTCMTRSGFKPPFPTWPAASSSCFSCSEPSQLPPPPLTVAAISAAAAPARRANSNPAAARVCTSKCSIRLAQQQHSTASTLDMVNGGATASHNRKPASSTEACGCPCCAHASMVSGSTMSTHASASEPRSSSKEL
mmetsp:Transcript_27574/g.46735  ORF Transcript_27574/g.46735 Transcript_27574/m.46735 type:complete len:219 (-) Transcript_27574:538-1194(-)